jgi:hypothetical protein
MDWCEHKILGIYFSIHIVGISKQIVIPAEQKFIISAASLGIPLYTPPPANHP